MRLLVLYDNVAEPPLIAGWGFSALVETQGRVFLFDAGADRGILEHNVETLGVDLSRVTDIFISHPHCDHIGGLSYPLELVEGGKMWAPESAVGPLRARARAAKMALFAVKEPRDLGDGFWSTGQMGLSPGEQGLIVPTDKGPILITGCAHPGVERMARRAVRLTGRKLRLVIGGFHLLDADAERLREVVQGLQETTEGVAPGHCTGEKATEALLSAFPGSPHLKVGLQMEFP